MAAQCAAVSLAQANQLPYFRDCIALVFLSLTHVHVTSAVASVQTFNLSNL